MYSKNNHDRHPLEREYFDRPVNYIHKGFLFSPKYKMPLDLADNDKSHYNLNENSVRHGQPSPFFRSTTIVSQQSQLTTGMPDHLLYNTMGPSKPRILNEEAGKRSDHIRGIPSLREPIKHKKGYRNVGMK